MHSVSILAVHIQNEHKNIGLARKRRTGKGWAGRPRNRFLLHSAEGKIFVSEKIFPGFVYAIGPEVYEET